MIDKIHKFMSSISNNRDAQAFIASLSKDEKEQIDNLVSKNISSTAKWTEKIYWIFHKLENYPVKCRVCEMVIKNGAFANVQSGYSLPKCYCSTKCRSNDPEFTKKFQSTNLKKYGVTSNLHIPETRSKIVANWKEKFGYNNPMQNVDIQAKARATNLKRLGVEYPAQAESVRAKYRSTCLKLYGVINSFNAPNTKITCLKRYGVSNPMQCPEIFNKVNNYRRKHGTFPSGKVYVYQGYENVAINELCKIFNENDIFIGDTKKIPIVEYFNPVKGKNCIYFPDIYIKSQNLIIEVKSTYTFSKHISQNLAKKNACVSCGYNFEFWICSKDELIEIIN